MADHGRSHRNARLAVAGALVCLAALVIGSLVAGRPIPLAADAPVVDRERPHVVLVMVDTLRADGLSLYGNPRRTSPNIDALARSSAVFERAYAQAPWTAPSVASFFTGTYQSVHQVRRHHDQDPELSVLDDGFTTLAEMLRGVGYETAAFSSQAWILPETGFAQGFDEFHVVSRIEDTYEIDRVLQGGLAWIERHRAREQSPGPEQPFFLYLHVLPPHSPYAPPPPFDRLYWNARVPPAMRDLSALPIAKQWDALLSLGKPRGRPVTDEDVAYMRAMYDGEVSYVDWWVGALHRQLGSWNMLERTLVIVTSDHGENFREHGLFGHAQRVYNPELAIPLVLSNPTLFPRQRRIATPVESIDLMPTLARLSGAPLPSHAQGADLLDSSSRSGVAYSEGTNLRELKLQSAEWSLIVDADFEDWELYDLVHDPAETRNLYEERSDVAGPLAKELLERHRANRAHPARTTGDQTTALDPAMRDRLRAMGYVE